MQTDRIHLRREPVSGPGPWPWAWGLRQHWFLFCSCLLQAQNVGTDLMARPAGAGHKWNGEGVSHGRWMGNDRPGLGASGLVDPP